MGIRIALRRAALLSLGLLLWAAPGRAQQATETRAETLSDIDREITPPISDTPYLKLQSNTYVLDVESFQTRRLQEVLQLQPLVPIPLTDALSVVMRPTFNLLNDTPYRNANRSLSRAAGFGDTEVPTVLAFQAGHWQAGVGPTFVLPTATSDETGKGKWQAGPVAVLGYRSEDWLLGLFGQQFWSFAGSGNRSNVSELKLQYFLTRYLHDGWNVGMSPTILANWKADGGQQLTFPVGLGVGKVMQIPGGPPVKLGLQVQYMPIHPDEFGQEWNVQLTVTFVAPKLLKKPLFSSGALEKSE